MEILLPSTIKGDMTVGEIVGTGSGVQTDLSFPSGIKGFTLLAYSLDDTPAAGSVVFYAALNNTPFNDPQTAGLRWVIPVGKSIAVPCDGFAVKPTMLSIYTSAANDEACFWAVAT